MRLRELSCWLVCCTFAPLGWSGDPLGSEQGASSAAPADAGVPEAQPETFRRERERVLHLHGGAAIRARSRLRDGAWEVRAGERWQTLPAESVAHVFETKELLAEARRRRSSDPEERVTLADWMRAQGLLAECLTTLDELLREDPDHPGTLRLLRDRWADSEARRSPIRLPSPDDADAFLRAASNLPPAAREIAVRQLLGASNPIELRTTLSDELTAAAPARRSFAALALRRLFPGEAAERLLSRAVLDSVGSVRSEAARGLRDADDEDLAGPLVRALTSNHSAVRLHAIEALEIVGTRAAVPNLVEHLSTISTGPASSGGARRAPAANLFVGRQRAYVQDFDVEVAQGESISDPTIGTLTEGSVLDVRVLSVTGVSATSERKAVRRALASITGAAPGTTNAAWRHWWNTKGAQWLAAPRPQTPER